MANAAQDENRVVAGLAVLNTDTTQGTNLVRVKVTNGGAMYVNTSDTISFTMIPIDEKDDNYKNCLTFTGTDGNIYPWVANSDGEVLINT